MQRDTAADNFRTAESLESVLEKANLPILPALTLGGRKMQQLDGQYYYLFNWYDGRALKPEEVQPQHARTVGSLLARIHSLDCRQEICAPDPTDINWNGYIRAFAGRAGRLPGLLEKHRDLLYGMQAGCNAAFSRLPPVMAICHNDMDCKNVLWLGDECRIIDLECLSYASPDMEVYEMALCWSGYEKHDFRFDLFDALISAYLSAGGRLHANAETLADAAGSRLEWLQYNLDRALGTDCGPEEAALGESQAEETLGLIEYYSDIRRELIAHLKRLVPRASENTEG